MLRRLMKGLNKQEGFTLLEVLVVIAILGIIAALITPKFLQVMSDARVDTAQAGAKQVQLGLERFNFKNNRYPLGEDAGTSAQIANYRSLLNILGSSVNLPAPATTGSNDAPDSSPVGYVQYNSDTGASYELILSVANGADGDGNTRCVKVTPAAITVGIQDGVAGAFTCEAP